MTKTYIETLVGKRVRYTHPRLSSWFTFKIREKSESNGYTIKYDTIHPDDGCLLISNMKADGTHTYDPDYNLIVHPDDVNLPAHTPTRAEIQAEIDRLRKQLEGMPAEFPVVRRFLGWDANSNVIGMLCKEVNNVTNCYTWDHISEVEIREVRRIK